MTPVDFSYFVPIRVLPKQADRSRIVNPKACTVCKGDRFVLAEPANVYGRCDGCAGAGCTACSGAGYRKLVPAAPVYLQCPLCVADPPRPPFVQHYQPADRVANVAQLTRAFYRVGPTTPMEGPVRLDVCFCFEWRKSENKRNRADGWLWRDTGGDRDNLLKPLCDALQEAGWVGNDSQFVVGRTDKIWTDKDGVYVRARQPVEVKPLWFPARDNQQGELDLQDEPAAVG